MERAPAAAPLRTALELMCTQAQQNDGQALRWMSLGLAIVQESAAGELWDDAIYFQLATNMVRQARDAGALALLPPALAYQAGDPRSGGRIRNSGNAYRRGELDHRSHWLLASEDTTHCPCLPGVVFRPTQSP